MAGPFAFGIVAFVLLFVSANILFQLMELVSQLHLGLGTAVWLFFLKLPGFVVYTVPLATLLAMLVAFGRLSGDSELVAMYAGGVSFQRLVVPLVVVGLVLSAATAGLNDIVVPAANRRAEDIIRTASQRAGAAAQEGVLLKDVSDGQTVRIVYADRLDIATGEMTNPTIVWFSHGAPAMVTVARVARWQGKDWELLHGASYLLQPQKPASSTFEQTVAHFPTSPREISEMSLTPEQMTYQELRERIRQEAERHRPVAELQLTLYQKFSIPFACLVFALIAPPLGARSHRGSSAIGMGIAILIGFAYYVVSHYMAVVTQSGQLSPLWAAWLPNIAGAAVGLGLIFAVRK